MTNPKDVGRVLGAQIYCYPSFNDIPDTIPLSANDFFVNSSTGEVYSYIDAEHGWQYKFAIPNNELLVSNEQRIAAVEAYFTNGAANRAIADANGNNIPQTYETKADAQAKLQQVVNGDVTAMMAERDADGFVISSEYPRKSQPNVFAERNTFIDGVDIGHGASVGLFNGFVYSNNKLFIKIGVEGGPFTYYQVPFSHADGFIHDEAVHTLGTTDQIAAARQEAVSASNDYTVELINALRQNFQGTNAQFDTLAANVFRVVKFIAETTETVNARVETRFFEFLYGQPVTVLGYVGFIVNRNSGRDFFFGMHDDTFVMGDCVVHRDSEGNAQSITMYSELPLAGRDQSENFVDGNLVKAVRENDSVTFKDAGVNPVQMAQDEALRVSNESARQLNEATRQSQETSRVAAERERFRSHPKPITYAQYRHIKDDGWYVNLLADGSQTVTETQPETYVYSYQYQDDAVYDPVDDTEAAAMFAACSEASAYIASQQDVTAEQMAELIQQGLVDPDKRYYVEDNELYEQLTVAIPEAEATRQSNEGTRQANESVRLGNLEADLKSRNWPITQAEYDTLYDNGNLTGRFGVHFDSNNQPVCTVYASLALAEAAEETYIFPIQDGIQYPAKDVAGDSPYLNFPAPPQADGHYVFGCTVSNGIATFAWEAD